ncbi:MAG TPA: prepilin-type N-terminal cleavage/methylation domain-containing protein [Methylocella sp.]|jgi:general secretion pathway protein J
MKGWRNCVPRLASGEGGFTLLEALIAVALMSVLLSTLGRVTAQWMPGWKAGFDRVQRADLLGLGLDRIVADLSAAEFVSQGGENAPLLFSGTSSSVTFVRSAIGPNASAGLEIVRLSETDNERGRVFVRDRVPFVPLAAKDTDTGELEFTNPIVLVRPPFHVSFAFAGRDRIWQDTWHDAAQLPDAVRVTVRNAMTDQILPVSTAALLNVNAPAKCVSSTGGACGDQNGAAAVPTGPAAPQPAASQPGSGPQLP